MFATDFQLCIQYKAMADQKRKRMVMIGSAANPVTLAHRELGEVLTHSGLFDLVLWVPSGTRPDKSELAAPEHRLRMTELVFSEAWRKKQPTEFLLDLRDVSRANTPTIYLLREIQNEYPNAEIVFATGVDVLTPRSEYGGKCEVAYRWVEGVALLRNWTFVVLPREGYAHPDQLQREGKLPSHFIVLARPPSALGEISSTEVRRRVKAGEPYGDFVLPKVEEYIREHGLYR